MEKLVTMAAGGAIGVVLRPVGLVLGPKPARGL
jgi:hypothetical protein